MKKFSLKFMVVFILVLFTSFIYFIFLLKFCILNEIIFLKGAKYIMLLFILILILVILLINTDRQTNNKISLKKFLEL